MTMAHKSGNINKNEYGLIRWDLENTPENPAWVPQDKHHIEGIFVTHIGTEFFNQVKESYEMDQNCHILCPLLMKNCKDPSLSSKLDETCKKAYDGGRFHLLDGILYHRTKHTCFMAITDRSLINTILHEFHDSVAAGHLSEDRTLEREKTCSWWPNWKKDVSECCKTCDRCQKANRAPGKKNWNDDPYPRTKILLVNSSHGLGNNITSRRRQKLQFLPSISSQIHQNPNVFTMSRG
ncbi:hypothetical protein O181_086673 [Austropuccinia psidii MF-1]|uniref:Integrase zinc-binding domain-containing protein n=1 Tax=Austropuccinia psidii MF-1 TaxID=1389203 RepID=A0A9Q3FZP0_9BASI|nr:hypothetical protein [Austropuccinia psidii MF-1]